jgi:hypothetical protein
MSDTRYNEMEKWLDAPPDKFSSKY